MLDTINWRRSMRIRKIEGRGFFSNSRFSAGKKSGQDQFQKEEQCQKEISIIVQGGPKEMAHFLSE